MPNILTGSRLFFAAGFILLLYLAKFPPDRTISESDISKLDWAFILFVIAGITDILDGPMARRFEVTSSFGRRFDPLADKILVVGGFILLALYGKELTAISWPMVAVIIAREVFVTLVRHLSEHQGKQFAATWAGKLKMFLQSFAIGAVIIYVAHCQGETWALIVRNVSVWIAVIFTAISALIYLPRTKQIQFPGKR